MTSTQPRRITAILGNSQRLDGGSMFGNAPKALWSRWLEPDEENRVPLACRAMLVEEPDGRTILFEAGIGAFFEPKLRDRYGVVEEEHVLLRSLAEAGVTQEDIDIVVLSHLHFDHAGGLLSAWTGTTPAALLFPRARFVVGDGAWKRACHPHARDRASFIPELQALLEKSGRLDIVNKTDAPDALGVGYRFHESNGHTPGLLLTEVSMPGGPVVFAGDLVPGTPWVHLPITMGYDRFPEMLIDEKRELLTDLASRQGRLFYTHDPEVAMSGLESDPRGRFRPVHTVTNLSGLAH